jgi:DNA repair protein RadA/Sms
MKNKNYFQCIECGHREPRWLGRCPECGSWNSLQEKQQTALKKKGSSDLVQAPVPLDSIEIQEGLRFDSGISEVNRVLGGGIIKGSAILIGGEPGIGKSTLMLQVSARTKTRGRVLYISGEESAGQIRMRADRLGITGERIEIFSSTELSSILSTLDQVKPVVIIIDSIQTIYSAELGVVPGTVNQIKLCAQELISWAKARDAALFLIGHVTKGGVLAGPKVIEHIVDTVLYFDTGTEDIRILRATKNRFGAIDEIGIFQMSAAGLDVIQDPASIFITRREDNMPAGVAVAPTYEGSRVLLVEIQSLVVPAKGGISRVFSDRIDNARVSRMAAVLEKHLRLRFSDQDIYVNVAGGMRLGEVAIELPLCLALYSARINQPLPPSTSVIGEVSLAGEIRPVSHLERRLRTVMEMGYKSALHPVSPVNNSQFESLSLPVADIAQAVRSIFSD